MGGSKGGGGREGTPQNESKSAAKKTSGGGNMMTTTSGPMTRAAAHGGAVGGGGGAGADGAAGVSAAFRDRGAKKSAASAKDSDGFTIKDAEFPPLSRAPPQSAPPPASSPAPPRSPRSEAIFAKACLPLRRDANRQGPPATPLDAEPAAQGDGEPEGEFRMPADGARTPPRYDSDDDGAVPRVAPRAAAAPRAAPRAARGAAGAAARPAAKGTAVQQLEGKPRRSRHGRGQNAKDAKAAAGAAALAGILPPAGGSAPLGGGPPPSHAAAAHKGGTPMRRTCVMGLSSALRDRDMQPKLQALVMFFSFVVFHVHGVLELYAASLAADAAAAPTQAARDKILDDAFQTQAAQSKGDLFCKTLVYDVISKVFAAVKRRGEPTKPPTVGRTTRGNATAAPPPVPRLEQALNEYLTDPKVRAEFATCVVPAEATVDGLRAQAPNIVTSFENLFNVSNRQMQKRMLRTLHAITSKEAKKVQQRLGLAVEEELKLAKDLGAREAKCKAYDARRVYEVAVRSEAKERADFEIVQSGTDRAATDKANVALSAAVKTMLNKRAAFDAAETALETWRGTLSDADREAALNHLRTASFPPRHKRAAAAADGDDDAMEEAQPELSDILQSEQGRLRATLEQRDQLLYRAEMLRRGGEVDKSKGNLAPHSKPDIKCVCIEMSTLQKLLDKVTTNKRKIDDNTMNVRIWELFKPEALKHALKDWAGFGPSFKTDGVALHLAVVNQAALDRHTAEQDAQCKANARRAAGAVKDEPFEEEEAAEYEPNTTLEDDGKFNVFILPEGSVVTTLDPGRHNVLAAARLPFVTVERLLSTELLFSRADTELNALTEERGTAVITAAAYRHKLGIPQRRAETQRRNDRRRKSDPEFAAAEKALLESEKISTADPVKLLSALQARGSTFFTMSKDGFRRARARLHAHSAERSLLHRMVVMLLPSPLHFVVLGDAKFSGCAGVKLERTLREERPSQVLKDVNEFRSSMLEWLHRCVMAHPPQRMVIDKNGKKRIQRIYGLYMCVLPRGDGREEPYSVLWNRDVNAPINMQVRFWHEYHFGVAPKEFLRSTPKSDLIFSKACDYHYSWVDSENRIKRTTTAPSST